MATIISYNVNGIRAAIRKGFLEWLQRVNPDIVLIQETKAQPDQIPVFEFESMGYQVHIHSAVKKGYSGVASSQKSNPMLLKPASDTKSMTWKAGFYGQISEMFPLPVFTILRVRAVMNGKPLKWSGSMIFINIRII